MSKTKTYDIKYYDLDEESMQTLITDAKNGKDSAQLKLLEIFNNFLSKYVTLLFRGRYSLKDYDIRRFVALFVKDPIVRFYLVRNKLDGKGNKHVAECMNGIVYMTQRYGEEADVRQTVNLAFFQCLNRYERKSSIPFSAYLYSYYFYVLKKLVDAFLIDQLGRKTFPLVGDDEETEDDNNLQPGFKAPPEPSVEELIGSEQIDEYWCMGDTAHGVFARLSIQERQLLKWRYVDSILDTEGIPRNVRSSDVAYRITEHSNTSRERLSKIKDKLKEYLAEELG